MTWSLLSVRAALVVTREPGQLGAREGGVGKAQRYPGSIAAALGGAELCLHFILRCRRVHVL